MKLIIGLTAAILAAFIHPYALARCSALFGVVAPARGIVIGVAMKGVLTNLFPQMTPHAVAETLLANAGERVSEEEGSYLIASTSMGDRDYRIRFQARALAGREMTVLNGIQPIGQEHWETQPWEFPTGFNSHLRHHPAPDQVKWNQESGMQRTEIGMDQGTFWSRVLVWSRPFSRARAEREIYDRAIVKILNWEKKIKTYLITYRIREEGKTPQDSRWQIVKIEDLGKGGNQQVERVTREFGDTYAGEYSRTELRLELEGGAMQVEISGRNNAVLTELEGVTRGDLESAFKHTLHSRPYRDGPSNRNYLRIVGIGENGKLLSIRILQGSEGHEEKPGLVSARELRSDQLKKLKESRR